jgi:hypothetical protein
LGKFMPMEQARFEALVARMERLATARPGANRRRVFGLALVGYGYLAAIVLMVLTLVLAGAALRPRIRGSEGLFDL